MRKLITAVVFGAVLFATTSVMGVAAQKYQTRSNWTGGIAGGNMAFWDSEVISTWPNASMWKNCPILAIQQDPYFGTVYMDDMNTFTVTEWTVTETGAGGTVVPTANGIGGILLITTDALDNDSEELQRVAAGVTAADWSLTAGRALWFEAKVAVSDVTESDYIIGIAEADTTVIDGLADGGVYFRKDDGDANIDIVTEEATVETAADSGVDATDTTFIRYGFYYDGATAGTVYFYINGVQVGTSTTNLPNHNMVVTIAFQNGEAGAETMDVDYVKVVQLR